MRSNTINYFSGEEEFRVHIFQEYKSDLNLARWIFDHEKDHFLMAKKLGYSPRFAHDFGNFKFFVSLGEEDNPSRLDAVKIALAPKNLGREDLEQAYLLMNSVRRF